MLQENCVETFAILERLNKLQEEIRKIQESLTTFEVNSSIKEYDEPKEDHKYDFDDSNRKIKSTECVEKENIINNC